MEVIYIIFIIIQILSVSNFRTWSTEPVKYSKNIEHNVNNNPQRERKKDTNILFKESENYNYELSDTMLLKNITSNYPILTTVSKVFEQLGEPSDTGSYKAYIIVSQKDVDQILPPHQNDTSFVTTDFIYTDKGLVYQKKNDVVKLKSVDFKKNKDFKMYTKVNGIEFEISRNFSINDLQEKLGYTFESEILAYGSTRMSPHELRDGRLGGCFYETAFATGEYFNTTIKFYFDCNKKLTYLYIINIF